MVGVFEVEVFEEFCGELCVDGGKVFGVDVWGVFVGKDECGDLE